MFKRVLNAALAIGLASAVAQPVRAAMHATPEFESGGTRPRTIVFLPPHVDVIKRKIVQSEAQIEEGVEFSAYLGASLHSEFTAQGYEVTVLTAAQIDADPELKELVVDADRRYSELLTQVRTKLPRQIRKRRYQAGDEMRLLAAKLGVDAIGFADLQIVASAAGASAVAVLVGFGAAGSSTLLSVSLIDGNTANIEAFFVPPVMRRGSLAGYDAILADPAGKISDMTRVTVRDLPPVDEAARTPVESDEDVVSDIESLLKE
jgi:hypothetical protein